MIGRCRRMGRLMRRDEQGFTMLEALIGVLMLGLLTVLVLNQQVTANQVQQTNQGRDRAQAVAQDILHQAQTAGCGAIVGTESSTIVTQTLGGCNWANINNGVLLGTTPQWSAPTTIRGLCSAASNRGSGSNLAFLDSTPWFCQEQDGQWFTVQLRTEWTTLNGQPPSQCGTAATQPLQVARTADVQWVNNGSLVQQSWTVLSPVPPNAVATQLIDGGDLLVGLPAAGPVQMVTTSGNNLVVWTSSNQGWLPFLPGGFQAQVSAPLDPSASPVQQTITAGTVACVTL